MDLELGAVLADNLEVRISRVIEKISKILVYGSHDEAHFSREYRMSHCTGLRVVGMKGIVELVEVLEGKRQELRVRYKALWTSSEDHTYHVGRQYSCICVLPGKGTLKQKGQLCRPILDS